MTVTGIVTDHALGEGTVAYQVNLLFRGRECSGQTVQLQRTTSRARSARLGLGAAASKTTQLLLAANGSSVCPPFVFSLLPSCCTHALAHDLQRLRPRPSWEAKTGLIGGTGTGRAAGRFRWSLDSDCNAARGTAVSRSVPRTRRNQSAAATPPAGAARRPSGHALGATPLPSQACSIGRSGLATVPDHAGLRTVTGQRQGPVL